MKKSIYFLLTLLILFSLSANSQEDEKAWLSGTFGVFPMDYSTVSGIEAHHDAFGYIGVPVTFGLQAEFGRNKNISYTSDINFSYTGYGWSSYEEVWFDGDVGEIAYTNWTKTTLKFRVMLGLRNYYEVNEKFAKYYSLSFGYKYINRVRTKDGERKGGIKYSIEETLYGGILSSLAMRIAWGKKWYLRENFALSCELGLGGGATPFRFGAEFKL